MSRSAKKRQTHANRTKARLNRRRDAADVLVMEFVAGLLARLVTGGVGTGEVGTEDINAGRAVLFDPLVFRYKHCQN